MLSEGVALAGLGVVALVVLVGALVWFHRAGGEASERVAEAEVALAEDDTEDTKRDLERVRAQLREEEAAHAESRQRFARVLQLALRSAAYRESLAGLGLADGRGDVRDLREWLRLNGAEDEGGEGPQGPADPDAPPGFVGPDSGLG